MTDPKQRDRLAHHALLERDGLLLLPKRERGQAEGGLHPELTQLIVQHLRGHGDGASLDRLPDRHRRREVGRVSANGRSEGRLDPGVGPPRPAAP